MTECIQECFSFSPHFQREVIGRFDAAPVSSDAGALLLCEADRTLRLLPRLTQCFTDAREPERIEHTVEQMLAQRVYGLALGYEDLNDHDTLRTDPLLGLLSGKPEPGTDLLAGKSTLNRLELTQPVSDAAHHRYHNILFDPESADQLLVQLFLEAHPTPPEQIVLDLDATDDPLHGSQEGRFFHGYYGHYCYLPLYVFCGNQRLCARLRTSNQDASAGTVDEVERLVGQIRQHWPQVQVTLRADSGFCREALMNRCEEHEVDYVFGLAGNRRLEVLLAEAQAEVKQQYEATAQPARQFRELRYQTLETWSRERRVVAKAEHLSKGANPRFVVTSLADEHWPAPALYEQLYCARGEMENRIKEQFELFADRRSTPWLWSNQVRWYWSAFAYVLVERLRRLGLRGTALAEAEGQTIRTRLLKIGAVVKLSVRRIWVSLSRAHPAQTVFAQAWRALRG